MERPGPPGPPGGPADATLVVGGGMVITMGADRAIYDDGAVAIAGDRIVGVGPAADIDRRFRAARRLDARGGLILPGLVDGHHHPGQYLSKGIGDDVGILEWLYERVYPYEAACSEDDVYVGALGDFVEMVSSGTTCFCDPGGYHEDAVARAAQEVGLRGILSRSTRDLHDSRYPLPERLRETTDQAVERGARLVARFKGGGRLRAWYSLRVPYNVTDALCVAIRDLAEKDGVGIHSHVCAQDGENEMSIARWGMRVLERLRGLDLLRPSLYMAHAGWVTEEEIGWLKVGGVKVAHCPSASMHGSYGNIARGTIPRMVAAGIPMSLGTDSATAGRVLDMFRVMYLAACAHKDATLDATVMGAYRALEMATLGGAEALRWADAIGSLEVGKQADLIVVDTSGPAWHPLGDPVRSLVYSGSGDSVRTVVVDGRVIMRDRVFPDIDVAALTVEVERRASAVLTRAGVRLASRWPRR
jgi:cytosine/adenosine deaminase-related metal-dependent hydrolase